MRKRPVVIVTIILLLCFEAYCAIDGWIINDGWELFKRIDRSTAIGLSVFIGLTTLYCVALLAIATRKLPSSTPLSYAKIVRLERRLSIAGGIGIVSGCTCMLLLASPSEFVQ